MVSAVQLSPLPDLTGALRAYVRSLPGIPELVGDRVWIGWPRDPNGGLRIKVPPYLHAILLETGRGGLPPEPYAPFLYERVDISCLGPDEAGAHALWRQLAAYLVDPGHRRPVSFRAANTLVSLVIQEGGPLRQVDPATGWPRTWAGYQVRYCGIPVSELP
jgi:hypothetical protein